MTSGEQWALPPRWFKLALLIARLARKTSFGRIQVQRVRNWLLRGAFYELHLSGSHRWRDMAVTLDHLRSLPMAGRGEELLRIIEPVCSGCRDTVAELLDVPPVRVHCSLKVLVRDGDEHRVATIGRSSNLLDRPPEWDVYHEVRRNTVFAALCGESDGRRTWRPLSYFSCNDLTKRAEEFSCDRADWARYYKSTLAAPLRYRDYGSRLSKIIGFLTFDMPTTGEFTGVPDAFSMDFHRYHEEAALPSVIHCVGTMADTLAVLLRPVLEE